MTTRPMHNVPDFRSLRTEAQGNQSIAKINEQILKQLKLLEDTKINLMVMEADRQRVHFGSIGYHTTGSKFKDNQMMTNYSSLSVFVLTIIDYYLQGVNFYYKNQHDLSKVYLMLKEYMHVWTVRSHADPDASMPPIADFIAIDDYLAKIHPDHELNQIAIGPHNISDILKESRKRATLTNATSNAFKRMLRVGEAKVKGEHSITGFKPTRYEPMLDKFHENVWR